MTTRAIGPDALVRAAEELSEQLDAFDALLSGDDGDVFVRRQVVRMRAICRDLMWELGCELPEEYVHEATT